jgi:hypothetical protein
MSSAYFSKIAKAHSLYLSAFLERNERAYH